MVGLEMPRLPVHLPDFQFGGGLAEGEHYQLTASEVRFGCQLKYLAITIDGSNGPLRHGKFPIRQGSVREDSVLLNDADYLALYLNLFWQIEKKQVSWVRVEGLYNEVLQELQRREISVMLS